MNRIIRYMRSQLRRFIGKQAKTAWISHSIFTESLIDILHPESPKRIPAIEKELKKQGIWKALQKIKAPEVEDSRLALVHPRKYLHFLESVQPRKGKIYRLDDDTVMCSQSLLSARYAAGAVVKAVDMVMKKDAFHAFCAVRPPGHHAQSDKAGGFCLLNNVAVGAMHAISRFRLQRVAVIDFDVHYGDGTAEIFKDDPRVLFLNCYQQDLYPFPSQCCDGDDTYCVNIAFPSQTGSNVFRKAIRAHWLPKLKAFKPELILLSAGFDGHKHDETGLLNLNEADYAWLTDKIIQTASSCKGRIVSVLEGGYTLDCLAKSAAAHLHVLAGLGQPEYALQYEQLLKDQETKNN